MTSVVRNKLRKNHKMIRVPSYFCL